MSGMTTFHHALNASATAWIAELNALAARWQGGDAASQADIDEAVFLWRQRLKQPATSGEEWFDIVDAAGVPLGLTAPRWFAHLTGLRHRVVHVLLTTPQGLLVLQMRAHTKDEWPDHLSTTVAGHLKAGQDWNDGVLSEVEEEIGLAPADRHRWLAQTRLLPVGGPFEHVGRERDPARQRDSLLQIDRQVNQIYTGVLTAWGLAHVRFADGEVDGLYLTTPLEAKRLVDGRDPLIAPGLLGVLPRWWTYYHRAG